jgi:heme/copper-type cytochrome/quinol oxidase subunit 2
LPTTDDFRHNWVLHHPKRFTTTVDEKEAEFNAWLQEVKDDAYRAGFEDAHEELQGPVDTSPDPC